jgi:hypothetical protein
VPELTLDNDERNAFVCHLDGVSVSELVRREAAANASLERDLVQLQPGGAG